MRRPPTRPADTIRRLILDRPTVPVADLARLCGLTIQQVAGYRAAQTLKRQRRATVTPHRLKAQLRTARRRAEGPLQRSLTTALQTTALVAKTLKALNRYL